MSDEEDVVYIKKRSAVDNEGKTMFVERRAFFSREAMDADVEITRKSYTGGVTNVEYYKTKVYKTPLDVGTLFNTDVPDR